MRAYAVYRDDVDGQLLVSRWRGPAAWWTPMTGALSMIDAYRTWHRLRGDRRPYGRRRGGRAHG